MIEVKNLTKRFGSVLAVDDLSFKVEEGQTLALIGTSGCGKTTTLKMINRLVEPSSGDIFVDGESVRDKPVEALRRHMGYVIQETGLFPHYTVGENIAVVPRLLGWPKEKIEKRTRRLLDQLGLDAGIYMDKFPGQLSGGQQQRVGLARAMAADPPVILMDEPFGALDPITRREIKRDFIELEELLRKTIIVVTHDVEEAFEMADKVCLLDRGRLQQLGPPETLLFDPASDFVSDFISGQQMQLEMEVVRLRDLFERLPETSRPGVTSRVSLAPDSSVRDALDRLGAAGREMPGGKVSHEGQTRYFDLASLMSAYFEYLKNR
jgi:osmoprotectant transport system ATP-binding protein